MVHEGTNHLQYTTMPTDAVMPPFEHVIEWVFGGGCLVLAIYALWLGINRRTLMPVLFYVAGAVTAFLEPIADVMGNAVHAPIGQNVAFVTNGHPVPWYAVLAYPWYFGLAPILLLDRLRRQDIAPAFWWKTTAIAALAVFAVEQIPVHYGLWIYYGVQPHKIGYMPIWMVAANLCSVMFPLMIVYKLYPILTGVRQWLVLLIVPGFACAGHAAAGWPMYNALGLDTEHVAPILLQVPSLFAVASCLVVIWVCMQIIYERIPASHHASAPARNAGGSAQHSRT